MRAARSVMSDVGTGRHARGRTRDARRTPGNTAAPGWPGEHCAGRLSVNWWMEAAAGPVIRDGDERAGLSAHEGVRSIFYYNTHVEPGQTMGLNLFESRYRIMVKRVMEDPSRNRELIFLPNFGDYVAASGDIGILARVDHYFPIPSDAMDPDDELPRAEIELTMHDRVMVLWHWVEPGTKGLHECTFKRLSLAPSPHLLEPLRDAMHISSVSRYIVRTQRGFLNIHSSPESPDNLDNVVGQLNELEEIVALEHRAGWVRHARGWSISRVRFDNWVWLVPVEPQALAPDAVLIESSQNTNYSHLVMHAASNEAVQKARLVYDQISAGSGAHVLAMQVPPMSETVSVSSVLERLAAIHFRDAVMLLSDGSGCASSLDKLNAAELQAKLETHASTHGLDRSEISSRAGNHEELLLIANARLEVEGERPRSRVVAAAEVAAQLLPGVEVLVACGAPCGLYISEVQFAREDNLNLCKPLASNDPDHGECSEAIVGVCFKHRPQHCYTLGSTLCCVQSLVSSCQNGARQRPSIISILPGFLSTCGARGSHKLDHSCTTPACSQICYVCIQIPV